MIAMFPIFHRADGPRMIVDRDQDGIEPCFPFGLGEKMIGNPYHEPVPVLLDQIIPPAFLVIEFQETRTAGLELGADQVGKWRAALEGWATPVSKRFPVDISCDVSIQSLGTDQLEALSLFANLWY